MYVEPDPVEAASVRSHPRALRRQATLAADPGGVAAPAAATTVGRSERSLIEAAEHDLCHEFPAIPAHQVAALVELLWAEFEDAAIRDFIPVLVRKQAREELRDHFRP